MALDHSEDVGDQVEAAARTAHPWIDRIARAGYVAKGVVYATVGILAGQVALGTGGKTTGPAAPSRASARSPSAR